MTPSTNSFSPSASSSSDGAASETAEHDHERDNQVAGRNLRQNDFFAFRVRGQEAAERESQPLHDCRIGHCDTGYDQRVHTVFGRRQKPRVDRYRQQHDEGCAGASDKIDDRALEHARD